MLNQIVPDIFYTPFDHVTDRPNLGYIKGERHSLMYDAGASPAHVADFMAALEQENLKTPALCAVSHAHWDHTFGLCALPCLSAASKKTNEYLETMSAWQWSDDAMRERMAAGLDTMFGYVTMHNEYADVSAIRVRPADLSFSGELAFDLGGLTARIIEVESPHSDDCLICFVPERRFVFLGDSPGKNLDVEFPFDPAHPELVGGAIAALRFNDGLLARYRAALEPLDFELCLSGHAEPMTKRALFEQVLVQPQ